MDLHCSHDSARLGLRDNLIRVKRSLAGLLRTARRIGRVASPGFPFAESPGRAERGNARLLASFLRLQGALSDAIDHAGNGCPRGLWRLEERLTDIARGWGIWKRSYARVMVQWPECPSHLAIAPGDFDALRGISADIAETLVSVEQGLFELYFEVDPSEGTDTASVVDADADDEDHPTSPGDALIEALSCGDPARAHALSVLLPDNFIVHTTIALRFFYGQDLKEMEGWAERFAGLLPPELLAPALYRADPAGPPVPRPSATPDVPEWLRCITFGPDRHCITVKGKPYRDVPTGIFDAFRLIFDATCRGTRAPRKDVLDAFGPGDDHPDRRFRADGYEELWNLIGSGKRGRGECGYRIDRRKLDEFGSRGAA